MANRPRRFWSLDILRGLCALAVFTTHWILWSDFAPAVGFESWLQQFFAAAYRIFVLLFWPTGGQHPAVICFFVLSGFCIYNPFERRSGQPIPVVKWSDYFIHRARRIMPVYWTGALLGLLLMVAMRWRFAASPLLVLHAAGTPAQIAARLGGYAAFWPDEIFAGNYTLGTVAVEILIYLAFPFFFVVAARGRWILLGAVAISLQLLALLLRPYVNPFVLFGSGLIVAFFWYLGALLVHWREQASWKVRGWWLGGGWALFLLLDRIRHFYGLNLIRQALWAILCMWLIGWLVDWERRNEALREQPWSRLLRWFGAISYSLYAVHTPVILLINWGMITWVHSDSYLWQLTLNLVISIIVAIAVHLGIERYFYRPRLNNSKPVGERGSGP